MPDLKLRSMHSPEKKDRTISAMADGAILGFSTSIFSARSCSSKTRFPAMAEYDSTVGATARFQRDYNGKQPGDPKKAAQVIVQLTKEDKPPLRLLLGSDAYNGAERNDTARLEEARKWRELSLSTDFGTT